MLNDFFNSGYLSEIRHQLVYSINALIHIARDYKIPVIWITQEFSPDLSDAPLYNKDNKRKYTIRGTKGCMILDDLGKMPNDIIIVKTRYSAFYGTNLDLVLKNLKIDHVLVAGINTHACVRTTVIDAYQRDYRVILISTCIASYEIKSVILCKKSL